MQHEKIDYEISELMKVSTVEAKNGNYVQAVGVAKKALNKIKESNLLYGHSSYTKIIPYYQKAGLYSEVEKFCLNELVPDIRLAFQRGMSQKCVEIQDVHFYQCVSKIYDKLRLSVKREKEENDEARFIKEFNFYESKWRYLQPIAEKIEQEKEYQEMLEVFGKDTSSWPEVVRRRFDSIL